MSEKERPLGFRAIIDPSTRCVTCGYEGPFSMGFVKRRGLNAGYECPGCLRRRGTNTQRGWAIATLVLLALGLAITAVAGGSVMHQLAFWCLWIFIVIVIMISHEIGHAAVAHLLGFRVFAVNIGVGPTLTEFRVGDTAVAVKVLPFGGSTHPATPDPRLFRLRWFLVSAAGLAVNAVIFALALWWTPTSSAQAAVRDALLWADGLTVLTNLWPARVTTPAGISATDGLLMLRAPRLSSQEIDEYVSVYEAFNALHPRQSVLPMSRDDEVAALAGAPPVVRAALAVRLMEKGYFDLAVTALRDALDSDLQAARTRAHTLTQLAWAEVLTGDATLIPDADRHSDEALRLMPWEPGVLTTRGIVLVALGRPDEGVALLEASRRPDSRPRDRAVVDAFLAWAALQNKDVFRARQLLAQVRAEDPSCVMTERVERLLVEFEVRSLLDYWREGRVADAVAIERLRTDLGSSTERLGDALRTYLGSERPSVEKAALVRRELSLRRFPADDEAVEWLADLASRL
jgi:hypothetical protein